MPRIARPWFRLYSSILDTRKVQNLPGDLFKTWVNLLSIASQADPRGTLPRIGDIAYRLRADIDTIMQQVEELRRRHLLDGDKHHLRIHDWPEWQPDSDANLTPGRRDKNAERTRKERATPALRTHRVEKKRIGEEEEETRARVTRRNIFVLYDNYMGKPSVTATMRDLLIQAEEDYPGECITHCFLAAARSSDGRRSWKYVEAILKRHQAEGCSEQPRATNGATSGRPAAPEGIYAAELSRLGLDKPAEFVANPYGASDGPPLVDQETP